VFRLACDYVGQAPTMQLFAREANRTLDSSVGEQRIRHYLRFLGDTLLLRLIEPLEIRLKKRRGQPKICLCDHGLRASWLQEVVPLDSTRLADVPELATLSGRIAESVVGALLSTVTGLDIAHLPARQGEPEVDFVLTIGTRRIPMEVKYRRRIDAMQDTEGLRTFLEKTANNAPFGILVTQDGAPPASDPRIVSIPLSVLMLLR
jgi:predicted AAA+ superfamily ATPase